MSHNVDLRVVKGFGDEWQRFDQSGLSRAELSQIFDSYFRVFPWHLLPPQAVGFDAGTGSGRWAAFVAPRVGRLHCVDASAQALEVARRNLSAFSNCEFHHATINNMPIADASMDFGYSLGVLHHIPDAAAALAACVAKLKPGAPFLAYLYYAFDNQPRTYRAIWKLSEVFRATLSRAPRWLRLAGSEVLAATVYFPLARTALVLERLGVNVKSFPLSFYRRRSYYVMRNDSLDRFGTALERRFTRAQVKEMMERAGLRDIVFSEEAPFWCAAGVKAG